MALHVHARTTLTTKQSNSVYHLPSQDCLYCSDLAEASLTVLASPTLSSKYVSEQVITSYKASTLHNTQD